MEEYLHSASGHLACTKDSPRTGRGRPCSGCWASSIHELGRPHDQAPTDTHTHLDILMYPPSSSFFDSLSLLAMSMPTIGPIPSVLSWAHCRHGSV